MTTFEIPAADILAAINGEGDAGRALYACKDRGERPAARRRLEAAAMRLEELRQGCRERFAAERGWTYRPLNHTRQKAAERLGICWRPPVDHPESYFIGRQLVAIVTHSYAREAEGLEDFARSCGLDIEFLPDSWHFPGWTKAAVLTPKSVH